MAKKEYLRGRPFLTVEITQRPAPNVNTKVKGWMNEPGAIQSFEKVSFLDRINNAGNYAVVIDIINSTVIRNTVAIRRRGYRRATTPPASPETVE